MKFFTDKWQFKLQNQEMGGSGDGGSGTPSGTGDANAGGQNNSDSNLISHDTLWDANPSEGQNPNGNGVQQNVQQQQPAVSGQERFQQHINSLDFAHGIDMPAAMAAMQNQDLEAFGTFIQQVGANAYRNAMVDANKVVQQQVDRMAESVKTDVSTSNATSALVQEMNNQLPFTKQTAFAPMAKLVLTQFMEKGATPAEAIKQVGAYFQNLSGEVSKMNPTPPSRRPAGGFQGGVHAAAGNEAEGSEDWIDFLGGPPAG